MTRDEQSPSRRDENGRRPDGRFAAGNRASPGRAPRALEIRHAEALRARVSPDDLADAAADILAIARNPKAKAGDRIAAFRALASAFGLDRAELVPPVAAGFSIGAALQADASLVDDIGRIMERVFAGDSKTIEAAPGGAP